MFNKEKKEKEKGKRTEYGAGIFFFSFRRVGEVTPLDHYDWLLVGRALKLSTSSTHAMLRFSQQSLQSCLFFSG